jgi:hypothetical protein
VIWRCEQLAKDVCSCGKFLCQEVLAGAVICYAFGYEVAMTVFTHMVTL